jgi:hypothetical protein
MKLVHAVTVTAPNGAALTLLIALLVIPFALGRLSKEEQQLPTAKQLNDLAETAKAWVRVADRVAGWKAAVYGAVGVVLGAFGGLAADFVANGSMSLGQLLRGGAVLGVIFLGTVAFIVIVERFKVIERLIKVDEEV